MIWLSMPMPNLRISRWWSTRPARMTRALRSWPQSYWSRPAYCPGWTAADAVAHLASGGDFYAEALTLGRGGEPKLPWGASTMEEFRAVRQAAVQKLLDGGPTAIVRASSKPAQSCKLSWSPAEESDLAKVAGIHVERLIPLGSWISMRLLELSAHDWDIRQPHEPDAHLSPTAVPALLSGMPELQLRLLRLRVREGLDGVYALSAGTAAWGFMIQGKNVTALDQGSRSCQGDASLALTLKA